MQWQSLLDWEEEKLWRGTVFRLSTAEWPYEAPVDLMLVEVPSSPSGFALMVSTGYKAGLFLLELPKSAKARGKVHAVSHRWLIRNWKRKIYSPCPVENIRVIANYPPGI